MYEVTYHMTTIVAPGLNRFANIKDYNAKNVLVNSTRHALEICNFCDPSIPGESTQAIKTYQGNSWYEHFRQNTQLVR